MALRVVTFPRVIAQRASAVAACLLVSVLLSACADDEPGPVALPSVSPAPSVSPSAAAPSPVAVPVDARAATPQGAAEFARFFYAEVAAAFQTQSPDRVSSLSLPDCETCRRYVASVRQAQIHNWRIDGGEFRILLAEAPRSGSDGTATVDVAWNFQPAIYYDTSGMKIHEAPAVVGVEETLRLQRRGGSWAVADIVAVTGS